MQENHKPDFVCSRTPWAGLYLPPNSPQARSTQTICTSCGGRRLLTSYLAKPNNPWLQLRYRPIQDGPRCRAVQASPGHVRWARRQQQHEDARVVGSADGWRKKQRPLETDVDLAAYEARWEWPRDYLSCDDPCCAPVCGPESVPWDAAEVHPGRGVLVVSRDEADEAAVAAAVWQSAVRFGGWGEEMQRIELGDVEGSYVVRRARPKQRRRRRVVVEEENRSALADEDNNGPLAGTDGEDDGFELISNSDSWCVVDEPGDSTFG